MPQQMRMHALEQALLACCLGDACLHRARTDRTTAATAERLLKPTAPARSRHVLRTGDPVCSTDRAASPRGPSATIWIGWSQSGQAIRRPMYLRSRTRNVVAQ